MSNQVVGVGTALSPPRMAPKNRCRPTPSRSRRQSTATRSLLRSLPCIGPPRPMKAKPASSNCWWIAAPIPTRAGGRPVDAYLGVSQTPSSSRTVAAPPRPRDSGTCRRTARTGADKSNRPANQRCRIQRRPPQFRHCRRHAAPAKDRLVLLELVQAPRLEARLRVLPPAVPAHQPPPARREIGGRPPGQRRRHPTGRRGSSYRTKFRARRPAALSPGTQPHFGYALFGQAMEQAVLPEVSDSLVHHLASIQHLDGHWELNLVRPRLSPRP